MEWLMNLRLASYLTRRHQLCDGLGKADTPGPTLKTGRGLVLSATSLRKRVLMSYEF